MKDMNWYLSIKASLPDGSEPPELGSGASCTFAATDRKGKRFPLPPPPPPPPLPPPSSSSDASARIRSAEATMSLSAAAASRDSLTLWRSHVEVSSGETVVAAAAEARGRTGLLDLLFCRARPATWTAEGTSTVSVHSYPSCTACTAAGARPGWSRNSRPRIPWGPQIPPRSPNPSAKGGGATTLV